MLKLTRKWYRGTHDGVRSWGRELILVNADQVLYAEKADDNGDNDDSTLVIGDTETQLRVEESLETIDKMCRKEKENG